MPREIEVKFRLDDPATLRARLDACGAKRIGQVLEANRIFDTPERRLLTADCGLRLRTCRPLEGKRPVSVTLTYKGPRSAAAPKVREEVETRVADASATATILERLGFREAIVYEKRRETWQLDECAVCLDELPKLGWFAEIEGPGAAAVDALRERLELPDQALLRETYVEMAAIRGAATSDGIKRLQFQTR